MAMVLLALIGHPSKLMLYDGWLKSPFRKTPCGKPVDQLCATRLNIIRNKHRGKIKRLKPNPIWRSMNCAVWSFGSVSA